MSLSIHRLEELIKLSRYTEATRVCAEMLAEGTLPAKQLARAYHLVAIAHYRRGDSYAAARSAEMAEGTAVAAGDGDLLGRIWSNLVEFYRSINDFAKAAEYGERWLQCLGMYPDMEVRRGRVHYNLALVYRNRREIPQALQHFQMAIRYLQAEWEADPHRASTLQGYLVQAHQMYAWTLYEEGNISEGDMLVRAGQALIREDDVEALREHVLLHCLRAYKVGDDETVRLSAEEFLASDTYGTKLQRFWAAWLMAMTYIRHGQFDAAQQLAWFCRDVAITLQLPHFMNRTLEIQKLIPQAQEQTG